MEERVKAILIEMFGTVAESVNMETNLFDIGLDSLTAIQFIVKIEEEFEIIIEDEELLFDNFDTIFKIMNIINSKFLSGQFG